MLIGVTGFIGSGKDTVADFLVRFHGFKRISFAASLKDATAAVFNWDRELLEGHTTSSRAWREQVDTWWANRLSMPHLTPRWVLQQWGTEVLRRGFHDDIWVASVENKLRAAKDHIVITDCRFPNEVKTIKDAGGIVLRVTRGPNPEWYDDALIATKDTGEDGAVEHLPAKNAALSRLAALKVHASEYCGPGLHYDHLLDNNDSIDQLHARIESIINH